MQFFRSNTGVEKVSFGQMIETETVMDKTFAEVEPFDLKGRFLEIDNQLTWTFDLHDLDVVYGLGQNIRGMNKRGYVYESFCTDDPNHTPDKKALYGAHNFLVVKGVDTWGMYIDFPGHVSYDVGFNHSDELTVNVKETHFDIYFFRGAITDIITTFRKMIGKSYVPPKWAFGYQQSRWSYEDHDSVMAIADRFDEEDIPCDAIYLDIDYMEDYKDFTISDIRFPNFNNFVQTLKERGFKLIPIIDAGVKIEPGYDVYEQGIEKDYFVNDHEGHPFVAAVWPGKVHFPDFLNAKARMWFGDFYHKMLDMGIEGFWNDMNEPAIFYSEKRLKEAIEFVKQQEGKNLDINTFFKLKDKILNLSNSVKDYKSMYHKLDGQIVNHYDVHNLFGYNMTRSAAEGFKRYNPNKRFFMLTRSSHIGMAKHSGIWTGDNHSWWEHLKLNIQMMPGLNMAGFLYSGADTGGFGGNVSPDLLVRWTQFSVFTPLLRNHSAMGTRRQEPWEVGAQAKIALRNAIRMRYALIPYLYSEFMKANLNATMLFSPIAFAYEDKHSQKVEDQLLFGDSLMLTPIYEQNATGRVVYLPEKMLYWDMSSFEKITDKPFKLFEQGHHYIDMPMDAFGAFLRPNKLMVVTNPQNRVSKIDSCHLTVIGYVENQATYELYDDDGISFDFMNDHISSTRITVTNVQGQYQISVDTNALDLKSLTFYLIDDSGECQVITQNLEQVELRRV